MSGVMTKVAIYGCIRIVFDLNGAPTWWWGSVVLVLGGATAVLGVLYAVLQRDLKKLLAYSTVENVGIIFIGLGLALAFKANGMASAAALALTAALFHVLNHSLFKSLLFFGAGAVLKSTGVRDIEKLGGLIHRMPQTAFAFLGGCLAISALPPLNGFASEWLVLQAVLLSQALGSGGGGDACARCRPLGRVLRARLWHHLPRPPAVAGGGRRARGGSQLTLGDVCPSRALSRCRAAAGRRHRWRRAAGAGSRWCAHAGAGRAAVAVDRAGGREPQLL
jgi:hypothetical protein